MRKYSFGIEKREAGENTTIVKVTLEAFSYTICDSDTTAMYLDTCNLKDSDIMSFKTVFAHEYYLITHFDKHYRFEEMHLSCHHLA